MSITPRGSNSNAERHIVACRRVEAPSPATMMPTIAIHSDGAAPSKEIQRDGPGSPGRSRSPRAVGSPCRGRAGGDIDDLHLARRRPRATGDPGYRTRPAEARRSRRCCPGHARGRTRSPCLRPLVADRPGRAAHPAPDRDALPARGRRPGGVLPDRWRHRRPRAPSTRAPGRPRLADRGRDAGDARRRGAPVRQSAGCWQPAASDSRSRSRWPGSP